MLPRGIAVQSDLRLIHEAKVDFDEEYSGRYGISKGALSNPAEGEIFAPVAMWLEAIELLLHRLRGQGLEFSRVKRLSGAGMQHGTVFWSQDADRLLKSLDPEKNMVEQLSSSRSSGFSQRYSPNWQDASTQAQCDAFDNHLGNEDVLAGVTGSKAHHVSSRSGFGLESLGLTLGISDSAGLKY